ncbi:MAG: type II toxin-antitoxin system HipA family toxin [Desulfovibrionaceae bacterium]
MIRYEPIRLLNVELDMGTSIHVGRLAWVDGEILFEFDRSFPIERLDISPFKLRPTPGSSVIKAPPRPFEGLHGIFNDSLPDGWGRLLMDRKLREVGIRPGQLTPLDRLAWVGSRGMGALCYRPEHPALGGKDDTPLDLDRLAGEARLVLADSPEAVFDRLLNVGGSPGGARPKALVGVSEDGSRLIHGADSLPEGYAHWLVKFGAREDAREAGSIEMAYAEMAQVAGVAMPETRLFPSNDGPGYFGIRRFDRDGNRRIHMHTISGLLHADFRLPSMDYTDLLKATFLLTRRQPDVDQMFTRMAFNVLAHNRDDHTKNHSFLMDSDGEWRLSPAYDVTFSDGPGGEQSLAVAGEGRNPGVKDLRTVGKAVGIAKATVEERIERALDAVRRWPEFAGKHGVGKRRSEEISAELKSLRDADHT